MGGQESDPVNPATLDPARLESLLAEQAPEVAASLSGPLRIVDASAARRGHTRVQVAAMHLVAVDDEDPELRDVAIPVPVTCEVDLDDTGRVVGVSVAQPDAEATRQARAFARGLIANGAVRGMPAGGGPARRSPGPPTRPTHELATEHGRQVIRRTGFSMTGGITGGVTGGITEGGRPGGVATGGVTNRATRRLDSRADHDPDETRATVQKGEEST